MIDRSTYTILISNRDLITANRNIDATFMIKICDLFLR